MYVVLTILTDKGWVIFARFFDMPACGMVLELISLAGGVAECARGIPL